MANHACVTTEKSMTPNDITKLLEGINQRVFKSILNIQYENCEEIQNAWGKHVWFINFEEDGIRYCNRIYWLNNSNEFEIRHGGSDFEWCIDDVTTNEVACLFNGKIKDDALETEYAGVPNQYDDILTKYKRLSPDQIKYFLEFFPTQLRII